PLIANQPEPSKKAPRSHASTPKARRKEGLLFALLAFPNLGLIVVFAYWPIIRNFALSFTSWDFISPSPTFIGLSNYSRMFSSESFMKVLWITLIWVVVVVGVSLALGVLLAALFHQKLPGTNAVT